MVRQIFCKRQKSNQQRYIGSTSRYIVQFEIMKGNGLNSMDFSTCLESAVPNNSSIFVDILFDRILPYLVRGILHGGVPPYILHITNRRYDEFQNGKSYFG